MVTAIRAAQVWDGTGAEAIRDGTVLIDGDKIVTVGPTASVTVPEGARTIDRGDEFVMPGLIDAHTHITIVPGLGNQVGQLLQPIERQTMRLHAANICLKIGKREHARAPIETVDEPKLQGQKEKLVAQLTGTAKK